MFILGIAIYLLGVLLVMFFKGLPLALLVNPSAIMMMLISLLAVLTATRGFKVFWHGLQAASRPKMILADDERGRAASLFRLLSKTVVSASILGIVISVATAYLNAADPQAHAHAMAAALVMLFWGLLPTLTIFEPVVFILKIRQTERKPKSQAA